MNIYLVRHGESVANVERYISGKTDVALTEKGVQQAREVAERLTDIKFTAVYSSNLRRAMDTAREIIKDRDLQLVTFKELQERDFGDWEGLTFRQIEAVFPDAWDAFVKRGYNAEVPGGEKIEDFFERVRRIFSHITEQHQAEPDENICIVVHGCVLMALFSYFSHGDLSGYNKYSFENARVNMVQYSGDYSIIRKLNA